MIGHFLVIPDAIAIVLFFIVYLFRGISVARFLGALMLFVGLFAIVLIGEPWLMNDNQSDILVGMFMFWLSLPIPLFLAALMALKPRSPAKVVEEYKNLPEEEKEKYRKWAKMGAEVAADYCTKKGKRDWANIFRKAAR